MGDEEEVRAMTMNIAFTTDVNEETGVATIAHWKLNWNPFWGEVTTYCSGCGIGKRTNAQYIEEWFCLHCRRDRLVCGRCKEQEFTHKHVQGRRFCSAPFVGLFKPLELFAINHGDTPAPIV